MGVRGLMTFMKQNGCCERVRLSDIADAYRNKTGKNPVLLVDLSSVIDGFYNSSPIIKTVSGEFKKFMENLKIFVNNCEQLGIEVQVFGDGKKPPHKYRIWMQRFAGKVDDLRKVYSGQTNTLGRLPGRMALLSLATDYLLLMDKCKYSRAIYEADSDIIKFIKTEECFAILTYDTDFFVLDNITYCLSKEDLNLESMTFINFNRINLAKLLEINTSQLPLFASLCSSSQFPSSDLLNLYKGEQINTEERFFEVAKLIKNLTSKEELIQYISSLKKPMEMSCLKGRLEFYFGEGKDVSQTAQNHWDEILKFAEEKHTKGEANCAILSVIQDKVNFLTPSCENIFMSSSEDGTLKIRKKIYGILFFEHPNSLIFVTEFSYGCPKSAHSTPRLRTVIVDRRPHPGLLKLWSLETSDSLKTSRQRVFCEAINDKLTAEDFSRLNIPVEYVFPIFALFYFLWECERKFTEFEVEIILTQAVLVRRLTGEQIDALPEEFHLEALDLTGWFFAIFRCLNLLNSVCGNPFCKHKTVLTNYFDGKVMHYAYGKLKERESPWTSFSEHKKEYETLISALYELGRICGYDEARENRASILNEDTED